MSDSCSIEWCDATWQPVVGCTRVSAGCDNCYAIGTVNRFRKADGLTKLRPKDASRPGLDWSGKVLLQPERLADPLKWRKPRRVFVCSQADLFHDAVPFEFIAAVFGVMASSRQHTFLVLTKRPSRAREYFAWVEKRASDYRSTSAPHGWLFVDAATAALPDSMIGGPSPWPVPNVHLGVSVEDQATANERIPTLLELPAVVRWVSYEPALGPVDIERWLWAHRERGAASIGWIVVGGESGPRARPFDVGWARAVVTQCHGMAYGSGRTPVFVKQLGSHVIQDGERRKKADYSGGDMSEWPHDIRVREVPT